MIIEQDTEKNINFNIFKITDEDSKFLIITFLIIGGFILSIVAMGLLYLNNKNEMMKEAFKLEKYEASEISCAFETLNNVYCGVLTASKRNLIDTKK